MAEEAQKRELPSRATRGRRMTELMEDDLKADNEYYNQAFFAESEEDEEFDEGSSESEDEVDADFDAPEVDDGIEEDDAAVAAEEKRERAKAQSHQYKDPAIAKMRAKKAAEEKAKAAAKAAAKAKRVAGEKKPRTGDEDEEKPDEDEEEEQEEEEKPSFLQVDETGDDGDDGDAEDARSQSQTPQSAQKRPRTERQTVATNRSLRTTTKKERERVVTLEQSRANDRERAEQRKKLAPKVKEIRRLTQEELLAEAKVTEQINIASLERMKSWMEEEKKKHQLSHKHQVIGPKITYVSRGGDNYVTFDEAALPTVLYPNARRKTPINIIK